MDIGHYSNYYGIFNFGHKWVKIIPRAIYLITTLIYAQYVHDYLIYVIKDYNTVKHAQLALRTTQSCHRWMEIRNSACKKQ